MDYQQLRKAIQHSRKRLQPYREKRVRSIREFVGRNYSDTGSRDRVPVNMLELFISTYSRQLVADEPNVMIRPVFGVLPRRRTVQLAKTTRFRRWTLKLRFGLQLSTPFSPWVSSKWVSPNLNKSGRRVSSTRPGSPSLSVSVLDDWVHDMSARSMEECGYMGHGYREYHHMLRESDLFTDAASIPSLARTHYNESGDTKASAIGQVTFIKGNFDAEYNELWEIWVPDKSKIVTFAAGETGMPERRVRGRLGWPASQRAIPFLAFTDVPGNTMPLPPVATLIDMHDLANRVFRKLGRQAERQKDIVGYRGSAEQDAKNVQGSADGEVVRMDDPQSINTFKFGGIGQQNGVLAASQV